MKQHGYFSWDGFLKGIYDINGQSCFPALLTHHQGMVKKAWISVIPIVFCEISGKPENPAVLLKVKSQLYAEHQGLRGDTDLTALSFLWCCSFGAFDGAGRWSRISKEPPGWVRAGLHWPLTSLPLFVKEASFSSFRELSVLCTSPVSPGPPALSCPLPPVPSISFSWAAPTPGSHPGS